MPKRNTAKDYGVALYETTRGLKGDKLEHAIKKFAGLLVSAGLSTQVDRIINEFTRYFKKQEGIVDIEITSARPISEKTLEKIKKSFGEKVEVTKKIDENLLGGVKIRTENTIFDGSIKKQLQLLKQNLI